MMWQLMSGSKDEEMELIYACMSVMCPALLPVTHTSLDLLFPVYLKQTSSHEKAIRRDLAR